MDFQLFSGRWIKRDWFFVFLSLMSLCAHFILRSFNVPTRFGLSLADIPLLIVIIGAGLPMIYDILRKTMVGDFGVDLLAAISIITSLILGEYIAGVLIVLMLSGGNALEEYATAKASGALKILANRAPLKAHVRRSGDVISVLVGDINIGDEVVVFPHEIVPVDGEVIEGHGVMDESFLTGEPYQVSKASGSLVISGAQNSQTMMVIRATRKNQDSRYAQIMKVMELAEQRRPKIRRLADQLGAVFTPVALIFAVLAWYLSGDSMRFLSIIIIATPCPLLIAVPITVISAISMAAQRGIIIKNPVVLEQLPLCRTAIFDKTGTLTYGKPTLIETLPSSEFSVSEILMYAASLELYSKHPLAEAIIQAAGSLNLKLRDVSYVSEPPGRGLLGGVDGHQIQVTHRRAILNDPEQSEIASQLPEVKPGLECVVLIDGRYGATLRFRDVVRSDGRSFIQHLPQSHGVSKIMLVSGDRDIEVSYLAEVLGINQALYSQTPEQKLEIVRREVGLAPTLFMGDGVNDAPAIALATVGLAFGDPTDVTAEAADAVIMGNTLEKVDELFHISMNMRKLALQSAVGGMVLCFAGMVIASLGYIPPVWGALIQEIIDILAIMNALRFIWSSAYKSDMI